MIGSSVFFHVPSDGSLHMRLPGGVEAWAGYRQAVKPCQFGLSFNIDLAATAFLTSGPMVEVMASVSGDESPWELGFCGGAPTSSFFVFVFGRSRVGRSCVLKGGKHPVAAVLVQHEFVVLLDLWHVVHLLRVGLQLVATVCACG